MPTISFPSTPSLNDTYTFGGKTWVWTGSYWALQSTGAINGIVIGNVTPSTGAFTTLSATGNTTLVTISSNVVPAANLTYSLGNATNQWANIYVGGNTIFLGSLQLKDAGGNTLGVYAADGTTPAAVDATSGLAQYVTEGAQGNITSVGTLTSLSVTGNIAAGNLSGTNVGGVLTTAGQPNITSVGTLNSLSVTGNITAGNLSGTGITGTLLTSSQTNITAVGTLTALAVTGNITSGNVSGTNVTGTLITAAQPNITSVGQLTSLGVTGNVTSGNLSGTTGTLTTLNVTNIVNSGANGTGNIGTSTTYFNTVFAKATSAQYADLAELYISDVEYAPGTVVVFGGQSEITQSTAYAQTSIAGVISTDPAFIMNSDATGLPVALQGRVPCRVAGTIRKGDLVTSSEIAGVATRLDPADWVPGSVIGKALETYDSTEPGIIEVVVGRV